MKYTWTIGLIFLLLVSACKKVEGRGGQGVIKGAILAQKRNAQGNVISEYPGFKEDVYILYGLDDNFYDDKLETSFDGSFVFDRLEKGDYLVFYYEKCVECPGGKKVIQIPVTLDKSKAMVDLGTLLMND